jgi:hypothetical protein
MTAPVKFYDFVNQLGLAKHDLSGHVFKIMLTNNVPNLTDTLKSNITDIAAGNGYVAGGTSTVNSWASALGVGTWTGTMVVFTAAGGSIGPFRYAVLYNDTQASPVKPLVCYWDNGSTVTLNSGDQFRVKFSGSTTTGTMGTLT